MALKRSHIRKGQGVGMNLAGSRNGQAVARGKEEEQCGWVEQIWKMEKEDRSWRSRRAKEQVYLIFIPSSIECFKKGIAWSAQGLG